MSQAEISKIYGCNKSTVFNIFKENNITSNEKNINKNSLYFNHKNWIDLINNGSTPEEIASESGLGIVSIKKYIKYMQHG